MRNCIHSCTDMHGFKIKRCTSLSKCFLSPLQVFVKRGSRNPQSGTIPNFQSELTWNFWSSANSSLPLLAAVRLQTQAPVCTCLVCVRALVCVICFFCDICLAILTVNTLEQTLQEVSLSFMNARIPARTLTVPRYYTIFFLPFYLWSIAPRFLLFPLFFYTEVADQ